jgi:hypothetical protein
MRWCGDGTLWVRSCGSCIPLRSRCQRPRTLSMAVLAVRRRVGSRAATAREVTAPWSQKSTFFFWEPQTKLKPWTQFENACFHYKDSNSRFGLERTRARSFHANASYAAGRDFCTAVCLNKKGDFGDEAVDFWLQPLHATGSPRISR